MELRENQEFALKKMLLALGDRAAGSSGFYEDDPVFESIPRATWAGLAKKEYVRIVDFVGGRLVCFLTGRGWRRALAISGMSESPEFLGRVAKLAKSLS